MRDAVAERRGLAVLLVHMVGIEVAGYTGEQIDVRLADGLGELHPMTDGNVVDRSTVQQSSTVPSLGPTLYL